jgi:3-hydroxyisobutyrate dehydrogenase
MALPRIGFVGLGIMGAPMAGHLLAAGHPLAAYDLSEDATRRFAEAHPGASIAPTLPQLAAQADIVITMLPNGRAVERVALGEQGLAGGLAPGALLLDTSSSEPWLTRRTAEALAARGITMVDAPVSGAQIGAQTAQLVFMAGGAAAPVERAMPILRRMGRVVFHLGPLGAGHAMKCINNLITAMNFLAAAEGLVIGKRYGLDPAVMNDVLNESTGMSWITQNHIGQRILSRRFDDPFKLDLMVKDIGIAMALAREAALPLPVSALGEQLWNAALREAGEGRSVSELIRWVEQRTQTEIASDGEPST